MKTILFTFFYLLTTVYSIAQITIHRNDLPIINDTIRVTQFDVSGIDYSTTGADYHWDFSTIGGTDEEVMEFKAALQTDYKLYFLGLTYFGLKGEDLTIGGYGLEDIYNFYEIDNSKYGIKGIGVKFQDAPLAAVYSKMDKIFSLPLKFGQTDDSQYAFKVEIPSLGTYKGDGTRTTIVDGWGKITTPNGSYDCLRTYSVANGTDSIIASIFGFELKLGLPVQKVEYQWWAKNQKVPVMSVEGRIIGGRFVPTKSYYKGINRHLSTSIHTTKKDFDWNVIQRSDISWEIRLNEPSTHQLLQVYSLDGKMIKSIKLNNTFTYVDLNIPEGIYVFVLESEKGILFKKVLKK